MTDIPPTISEGTITMATLAQHTTARDDRDLIVRIRAAAEQAGIPRAHIWAEENAGNVVSASISDGSAGTTTVADVHAYACQEKGLPPGADPSYVTDVQIIEAVSVVAAG